MKLRRILTRFKNVVFRRERPALNDLDRKLEKYLDFEAGFFIEAGANDGYQQSNTYFLERNLKWQGILVEGIPALYEKCKKIRKNAHVVNCGLVSNEYSSDSITMHFADLMSMVDGAMKSPTEQSKHIATGVKIQHLEESYSIAVPARTLASVLDDIPDLPNIDFLSLDVEGFELDVLKGLDIQRYRPRYILVEARYFNEVNEFLLQHKYSLVDQLSKHDFMYKVDQ